MFYFVKNKISAYKHYNNIVIFNHSNLYYFYVGIEHRNRSKIICLFHNVSCLLCILDLRLKNYTPIVIRI